MGVNGMITITADFNLNALNAYIDEQERLWQNELMEGYRTAGRNFVENARRKTRPVGFNNITWDLRSSIGYLLLNDGKVIESYFPTLQTGANGSVTGDAFAREIATSSEFNDGVGLILVAGMDYAKLVQSKGYDVTGGSEPGFIAEVKSMLKV
jgi:hypothetical protein